MGAVLLSADQRGLIRQMLRHALSGPVDLVLITDCEGIWRERKAQRVWIVTCTTPWVQKAGGGWNTARPGDQGWLTTLQPPPLLSNDFGMPAFSSRWAENQPSFLCIPMAPNGM